MTDKRHLLIAGQRPNDDFERLVEGDSATVIEALRERLESEPDDGPTWLRLGVAYLSIGHLADATGAFQRAVDELPDDVDARRLFATSLSRGRKLDAAVYQWIQARRLAPEDARVLKGLGVAFYDKKKFRKALLHLGQARQLAPDDPQIPYALALAHEGAGERVAALAWLRKTVAEAPHFVEARRTLADSLTAAGEMHEAAGELEEALRVERNNPEVATNLEVLRRGLGELRRQRILGKDAATFEASSLVREGQFKRVAFVREGEKVLAHRYAAALAEIWLLPEGDIDAARLLLHLSDPKEAAATQAPEFGVTVLAESGEPAHANYATAVSLMFLREALGCTMTRASALYRAALASGGTAIEWEDATIAFEALELGGAVQNGLVVALSTSSS